MKFAQAFVLIALLAAGQQSVSQTLFTLGSPDKNIAVRVWLNGAGEARYTVAYRQQTVLKESALGLMTEAEDFSKGLSFAGASPVRVVKDRYELFTGKKRVVNYRANGRTARFKKGANELGIEFRVSNDGLAFRYVFPTRIKAGTLIKGESTSFRFDTAARGFLQPMQVAKTGWEKTNPAYEEHYQQNIPVTDSSRLGAGFVYPALFRHNNVWLLITEAGVDSNHCATRLQNPTADGEYRIGFPDRREVVFDGGLLSRTTGKATEAFPWRIIAVGSLKTIAESTLGTDLAAPTVSGDFSFVKPGKSTWSWIMSKDDSIVYSEQVRYVDFAAKMNWQYCLIDVNWDRKIGYEKMKELSAYAASKNVGLLLWYNSAGPWNTVKYTPKDLLLTHESRMKEFGRIREMGIRGVKIDFFGGDGQSVMAYYRAILQDAAQAGLMVNFHGATLPRGWHRTHPNLVTTEAVKGFEMVTFGQADADAQPSHCAMLPFTRNAFDPMDFTPMNLYKIQSRVKRKTSSAFELATAVLFLSGIQHFAESPAGMSHVPDDVQQFLKDLPVRWDDVKFIDGFPGRYAVMARKAGNRWYVAGINGDNTERTIDLDLSAFKSQSAQLITDGDEPLSFATKEVSPKGRHSVRLKPAGGFVMVLR